MVAAGGMQALSFATRDAVPVALRRGLATPRATGLGKLDALLKTHQPGYGVTVAGLVGLYSRGAGPGA